MEKSLSRPMYVQQNAMVFVYFRLAEGTHAHYAWICTFLSCKKKKPTTFIDSLRGRVKERRLDSDPLPSAVSVQNPVEKRACFFALSETDSFYKT